MRSSGTAENQLAEAGLTSDAQREQVCLAYHGATAKMASYGAADKPLTFEIDAIT
ncbi:hypothetical protein J2D73_11450 [Acetobacter sacchari]|uniref:Uncharacterized protein n=1 Tax=Acetobacter sacchari TaxID=2661687 RepID=A0ABS3LWX0_9PROT|nr:hypothetical protein [Acetobacter sacchari]MBO1360402.1 hypothetical protein [Acetobacter sacchari]